VDFAAHILFYVVDGFVNVVLSLEQIVSGCAVGVESGRPQDIVGRWGGDEFLMLAKGVDISTLGKIGERCRKLIETSAVLCGKERIPVTVSIGGTLLRRGRPPQFAFDPADSLFASKAQGRNRTMVAEPEISD
jgi:diguanylate cyclase (GGDEF)-like protein